MVVSFASYSVSASLFAFCAAYYVSASLFTFCVFLKDDIRMPCGENTLLQLTLPSYIYRPHIIIVITTY